ncbi:MAG: class I SAM-dependent methyltransferase [Vicinamibacterales bacterium]
MGPLRIFAIACLDTGRLFARVGRVFNYLAAGTQRIGDLREGVERTWEDFNIRAADVASGLMPWEEDLVARFLKAGDRVLVVGSGTGRDLVALAERGYRVTGVEPSWKASAVAERALQQRGLSAEIVGAFFEDAAIAGPFEAIVFSYYCYCYIPESARRVAILRKASALLAPGGRVVVSYFARTRGSPPLTAVARVTARLSRSDWHPQEGDVLYPLAAADRARPLFHFEHVFVPGEVDEEGASAGLQVSYRKDAPADPVVVLERTSSVRPSPERT